MSKKRSLKTTLPSFEDLTAKPDRTDIPARIHAAAASQSAPPGPMRVFGDNPAKQWFGDLPEHDPDLCREILAQLRDLKGNAWHKALWTAYTKHYYSAGRHPYQSFDFSKLFD